MIKSIAFVLLLISCNLFANPDAIFLMYHRVGDSRYPSTNVTQSQFNEEMAYLAEHHFNVWPAQKIVRYLQQGKRVPANTVAIIFDDAYDSVYENAWPVLKRYGFPFTLFVATGPVDKHYQGMLTWKQINQMLAGGMNIGNHTVNHPYLAMISLPTITNEVMQAQKRIFQETGVTPTLFAYPFGEYSHRLENTIQELGFDAAFTQVSGAVNAYTDFYRLPRFPMNEKYADFERFKNILTMHAFNIRALQPDTMLGQNPPTIKFTVMTPNLKLSKMRCYASNNDTVKITLGRLNGVTLNLTQPFSERRNRINCTAEDDAGQWHWLGLLYIL